MMCACFWNVDGDCIHKDTQNGSCGVEENVRQKAIEANNSADVKPEVGAQPPKREYNTARDEICTDIISNCICDYCVHKPGMASDYCGDCSGGSEFVGRKLRPC